MRLVQYINEQEQKEILLLIGLPGSGKSTYISKLKKKHIVVSNDAYVEKKAKQWKVNYKEAFDRSDRDETVSSTFRAFDKAIKKGSNVIVDNTNMNKKERSYFLENAPPDYKKVAIIFDVSPKELEKRLKSREKEVGKQIPLEVLERMRKKYEKPTEREGFDEIKVVK